LVASALQRALAAASGAGAAGLIATVQQVLEQAPARIVLLPFRLALAPLVAPVSNWLPAFGVAVLVLLLHYVWVLRSKTAFEEAAADAGERRARAVHALRSGGGWRASSRALQRRRGRSGAVSPAAFQLSLTGRPALAITWKNLTFARRNT